MGGRYLVMSYPFWSIGLVQLLHKLKEKYHYRKILFVICSFILISAISEATLTSYLYKRNSTPVQLLAQSDIILIDNVARGVLPRMLLLMPPHKTVFIANQNYLLEHPDTWLPNLKENTIYVSLNGYGNTIKKQTNIVTLIDSRYNIHASQRNINKRFGTIFSVEERVQ